MSKIKFRNGASSLAEAAAMLGESPKESDRPKLQESVCRNFYPYHKDDSICQSCGHEESKHEELSQSGGGYRVVSDGMTSRIVHANRIDDFLAPAVYVLHKNQSGFFLEHSKQFNLPAKIYGSAHERSSRIIKAYKSRCNKSMGVICSGRPGTGKTILAKLTAYNAVATGIPVIVVRQPFSGSGMSSFLESLPNKCMIFVDEIEKVYEDDDARNWLLTVLDGTVKSPHLWVMTCNNPNIGEAFYNRPSRIRYHYQFDGLEEELVHGMINEQLEDKSRVDEVLKIALRIHALTPDVLMTIIDEVNIFGESPKSFLPYLNVDSSIPDTFSVTGFAHCLARGWQDQVQKYKGTEHEKEIKDFIGEYNRYGLMSAIECYPNALQFIPYEIKEVENMYSRDTLQQTNEGSVQVRVNVYEKGTPYSSRDKNEIRINWHPDEIEKIEIEGSSYIIHHKEQGVWLRLDPIKSFTRFNSNSV